jgi:mannosyltransferase
MVVLPLVLVLRIGRWSLWADEAFSVSTSNRSWESLAKLTYRSEVTGAVYAALLRQWLQVDSSVGWLRGLSVVFVVLCVPLLFGIGRRLFNQSAGAIAVVLFCGNATVLRYGQHIRFYSFVLLLVLLVTYCFVREIFAEGWAAVRWRGAWAFIAVLLVGTHLLAVPLLGALALARFVAPPVPARRRFVATVVALVPAGLATAVVAFLVTRRDEGQSLVTFHPIRTLSDVTQSMAGTPGILGTGFVIVGIATLLLTSRSLLLASQNRFPLTMVFSAIVLPTAVLYLASFVRPSLLGRYVLYSVPFLCLLIGAMATVILRQELDRFVDRTGLIASSASRFLAVGGIASILVGSALGIARWHRGVEVADWKSLAAEVFANSKPTDAIVFANDSNRLFFEYYRPKDALGIQAPLPLYPIDPWGGFETGKQQYSVFPLAVIENAKDTRTRLWVVVEAGVAEKSFPALDALTGLTVLRERTTSAGFARLYDLTKTSRP